MGHTRSIEDPGLLERMSQGSGFASNSGSIGGLGWSWKQELLPQMHMRTSLLDSEPHSVALRDI